MRRSLGAAAVFSALLAVVVGEGGCEIAIGDTVPGINACNGGSDPCPPGQACDMIHHQCVPACPKASCPQGTMCNITSGICDPLDSGMTGDVSVNDSSGGPDVAEAGMDAMMVEEEASPPMETGPDTTSNCPGGILCSCSGDSDCNSKLCVDQLSVGNGLYQAAGSKNFCSQPCCVSADCPQPTVCYATGQGGNYCVDPAWIGRTAGSGTKLGGDTCAMGRDCRSDWCDTGSGHCADTCCSTAQAGNECAGGTTCTFTNNFPGATAIDKNYAAYCGMGGNSAGGSQCFMPSDCASNLCATSGGSTMHCWDACRNGTDCTGSYSCEYVLGSTMATPAPIVGACYPVQGSLGIGAACNPSNDMCKGFCDPSTMLCTDVCFTDTDCAGTVGGWRCRDETIAVQGGGSYSVLCCGP